MKNLIVLVLIMFFGTVTCFAFAFDKSVAKNFAPYTFINRIEGIVWDPNRRPVPDVYVELQDENYSTLGRLRTDSSGRFSFTVARMGNYNVKVLASNTNYLDAVEPVEIVNGTRFSSDNRYVDIYLKLDKRKASNGITGITDAVFIQDVPEEARKLYNTGLKNINNKDEKGFDKIEQALNIYPNYFDALNKLGCAYTERKEYQKAVPYLIKSIDVNQRSFSSFYALAYVAFQLDHRTEALEAAKAATIIQANSVNAQLLYGTLLRLSANYEKAEKALLKAVSLSKADPIAETHWQLALLYNKINRNQEAANELEMYLKLKPSNTDKKEIKDLIIKLRKVK